ncbi:MAG: FAD-dependent oxidoreductase, partial [Tagaea sp.]
MSESPVYDLLIVGGGVNGCGIARDAAGRGLKVLLAEQNDLASATSSASSKLIHGGLRYLEHYEFRLVREALAERDVLLDCAPHIVWPMRFVLPHDASLRPVWMIRAGLFLYDHLGWTPGRKSRLPGSTKVDLPRSDYGRGLRADVPVGFVYSDCWVDDARLVALNARHAADLGAEIRVRTQVAAARRENGEWR